MWLIEEDTETAVDVTEVVDDVNSVREEVDVLLILSVVELVAIVVLEVELLVSMRDVKLLVAEDKADALRVVELEKDEKDDVVAIFAWYTIVLSAGENFLNPKIISQSNLNGPPHHSNLFPAQSMLQSPEAATAAAVAGNH